MFTEKEKQKSITVSTKNSLREQQAETTSRKPLHSHTKPLPQTSLPLETTAIPVDSFDYHSSIGSPLPANLHKEMSTLFQNKDLLQPKIHTDSQAASLSKKIHAKAFTIGTDIYFNQGQFNPHMEKGKQLLAHELVHTMQQKENSPIIYRSLLDGAIYPLLEKEQKEKIDKKTEEFYKKEIISYEADLGKGLSVLGESKQGADFLADKIIEMILERIKEGEKDTEYLGDNKASYLGKVKYTKKSLEKIKSTGNLREKMTLVWNFVSKGLAKTVSHPKGKLHLSQALINDPLFLKRDQNNPRIITHRSSTISLAAAQRTNRQTSLSYPADYVPDSILDELSYKEKKNAYYYDKAYETEGDIDRKKQQWKDKKKILPKEQVPQQFKSAHLHFKKGSAHYTAKEEYKKYCEDLGMISTAGYSGSTNMYYQAGVYLGADPDKMKKIRLAALGTMIPAGDHSFLEIMIAGQDFGMPFLPGPDSYAPLSPLSIDQTLQNANGRKKFKNGDDPIKEKQYEPAFYCSGEFKNALAREQFKNLSEIDLTFTPAQKEHFENSFKLPENPFEIDFPLKSNDLKTIFHLPESSDLTLFNPLKDLSPSNETNQTLETLKLLKKNCIDTLQGNHSPGFSQSILLVIQYTKQRIQRLEEIKSFTGVLSGEEYTPGEAVQSQTNRYLTVEAKQAVNQRIRIGTAARETADLFMPSSLHTAASLTPNEIASGFQKPFLYGGVFTTFNLLNPQEASVFSGFSDSAKLQTTLEQRRLTPKQVDDLQLLAAGFSSKQTSSLKIMPEEMNALVALDGGETTKKELKYIQILSCMFAPGDLLKSAQKIISDPKKLRDCLLVISAIKKIGEKEAIQYNQHNSIFQLKEDYLPKFKTFYNPLTPKISPNDLTIQKLEEIITKFESPA